MMAWFELIMTGRRVRFGCLCERELLDDRPRAKPMVNRVAG
jgi:hypothetical protein